MANVKSNIAKWDTKFNELVAYKDAHGGSCNVPTKGYAENPQLGTWVSTQRTQYKKFQQDPSTSSMTQERIERLESIAFEWGVTLSAEWDTKFHELVAYKDAHGGSCNVPQRYAENPQLGNWVHNQRTQYKKFQQDPSTSSMTQERIERLESIAFEWGVTLSAEWDTKFHELVAYKDAHGGSCNVPQRYAENPQLGNWVHNQRTQYKKFQQDPSTSQMTQERIERLESIGFEWNGRSLKTNAYLSEEYDDDNDCLLYTSDAADE